MNEKSDVTIKGKDYWRVKDKWFSVNKNGTVFTVVGKNILTTLDEQYELSNQDLGSAGVGDIISKITKAVGVEPCEGCERRKKYLKPIFVVEKNLVI